MLEKKSLRSLYILIVLLLLLFQVSLQVDSMESNLNSIEPEVKIGSVDKFESATFGKNVSFHHVIEDQRLKSFYIKDNVKHSWSLNPKNFQVDTSPPWRHPKIASVDVASLTQKEKMSDVKTENSTTQKKIITPNLSLKHSQQGLLTFDKVVLRAIVNLPTDTHAYYAAVFGDVDTYIQSTFDFTNTVLENNGINIELKLVKLIKNQFETSQDMICADSTDNSCQKARYLRSKNKADLLIHYPRVMQDVCGTARQKYSSGSKNVKSFVDIFINADCLDTGTILTHELGHVLGLAHSLEDYEEGVLWNYDRETAQRANFGRGYSVYGNFKTIMNVTDVGEGAEIPMFSNPLKAYNSVPIGKEIGAKDAANAVALMNHNALYVSNFYDDSVNSSTEINWDKILDPEFRRCIVEQNNNRGFYAEEVNEINCNTYSYQITNLEGIQQFQNLAKLRLQRSFPGIEINLNALIDAPFPKLRILELDDVKIDDYIYFMNFFAERSSLEKLRLNKIDIDKGRAENFFTFLNSKLTSFTMSTNSEFTFQFLSSSVLDDLKELNVMSTGFDRHENLQNFKNLERVFLNFTGSFEGIEWRKVWQLPPKLQFLSLGNNHQDSLEKFAQATSITHLDLGSLFHQTFYDFSKTEDLLSIGFYNNEIEYFTYNASLTSDSFGLKFLRFANLTTFVLTDPDITNLDALYMSNNIRSVRFAGYQESKLTDIRGLIPYLSQLQNLDLRNAKNISCLQLEKVRGGATWINANIRKLLEKNPSGNVFGSRWSDYISDSCDDSNDYEDIDADGIADPLDFDLNNNIVTDQYEKVFDLFDMQLDRNSDLDNDGLTLQQESNARTIPIDIIIDRVISQSSSSYLRQNTKSQSGVYQIFGADSDGDGVSDLEDELPRNRREVLDTDGDTVGNNRDQDDDNDGVSDLSDSFPLNQTESVDTDGDGIGNNNDDDDDNDGVIDQNDVFPFDSQESLDNDGDGIGNNADNDDDNDGVIDPNDVFPFDPQESVDTDGDGIGNNADNDDDDDGINDSNDAFPIDKNESVDTDSDGIGNNEDADDDNDGVIDENDAFPLDPARSDNQQEETPLTSSGEGGGVMSFLILIGFISFLLRRRKCYIREMRNSIEIP